jgi:hypothetical protein
MAYRNLVFGINDVLHSLQEGDNELIDDKISTKALRSAERKLRLEESSDLTQIEKKAVRAALMELIEGVLSDSDVSPIERRRVALAVQEGRQIDVI